MKKLALFIMFLSLFFMVSCASDDDSVTDADAVIIADADVIQDEEPIIDDDTVIQDEEPVIDDDTVVQDEEPVIDDDTVVQDEELLVDEDTVTFDEDEIVDADVDIEEPIETFTPGTYIRIYKVKAPKDAVTSHLLDVASHSWNYHFTGTISFGFTSMLDGTDDVVAEHTAIRFAGISIPENAEIDAVKIFIYPHNEVDSSKKIYMMFGFEDSANSAAFDTSNYDSGRPDQRVFAESKISEYLIKCDSDCRSDWMGEAYCEERVNDCWDRNTPYQIRDKNETFKAVVQSIVNKEDWYVGNAITFLASGMYPQEMTESEERAAYSGSRTLMGYSEEAKDKSPYMEVTFTVK